MQHHRGGLILALGIISIVVCGFVGPVAWVMGTRDLEEMRQGRMDPLGKGLTEAGRICGMVGTALLVLGILLTIVWVLFVVLAAAGGSM